MQLKCWHGSTFSWGHYVLVNDIKKERGTVVLFESQDENCKLGKALNRDTKLKHAWAALITHEDVPDAHVLPHLDFRRQPQRHSISTLDSLLGVRTVVTRITRDHWSLLFVEKAKPAQVRN